MPDPKSLQFQNMDFPESPSILDRYLRPGRVDDYSLRRKLYEQAATPNIAQQNVSTRDMTLGQVANLSDMPAEELASPNQYKTRSITEPSQVPSYRYVPTMTNGPEVHGPYDIRQEADINSVEQPITKHYPAPGAMAEATPQLRQKYNQPIGTLQEQPAPSVSYNKTELDPNQPADLFQQNLAAANVQRQSQWPRNMGQGGMMTLGAKIQALIASGLTPDQARQMAVLGNTAQDKTENLQARTNASRSRAENLDVNTELSPQKFHEQQRQNDFMNEYRNRSLAVRQNAEHRMQQAIGNRDWAQVERLNEQRYWHDQLLARADAIDKAGLHSDEERGALREALGSISQLHERAPSPQELSLYEKYLGGPRPRYEYTPRPPVTAPQQPTKGTAAPMGRQSTGSPATPSSSTPKSAAPARQSPVAVKSDEDYEKLAPGTVFIGPDGKQRTKP